MRFDYTLEELFPREIAKPIEFTLYRRGIGLALAAFGKRWIVDFNL